MSSRNLPLRLPKGGPEQQAIEAGEIDAIIDHASSNVVLLPAARRALRERADRISVANSVLAALPRSDYLALLDGLEPVTLTYGTVLYEPNEPIGHVFFPIDCLVSLLTKVEGRHAMEVGLVGREGMVGVALALGVEASCVRALVQGTGTAVRMKAARFHKAFQQCLPLQRELYRYAYAKLLQARQTAACNRFHEVQARLAGWLLLTRDRVHAEHFHVTHELLGETLGVRRSGVSNAAAALQRRKLISYRRGDIRILDRKGLQAASCGCYEIVRSLAC